MSGCPKTSMLIGSAGPRSPNRRSPGATPPGADGADGGEMTGRDWAILTAGKHPHAVIHPSATINPRKFMQVMELLWERLRRFRYRNSSMGYLNLTGATRGMQLCPTFRWPRWAFEWDRKILIS